VRPAARDGADRNGGAAVKVLVMGGTRFNGLALVQELAKWGHQVTVLNRGQSEARLPRAVRRLYADRTNHEQLREVLGREEFDVVQDMSGYALADVQPMVEVFRGRIGHYLFASSTVIYARPRVLPIRESDPVDRSERQTVYGIQKLAVEAYLFDQYRTNGFPATVVPLSMVFGPNNISADREQRMFHRLLQGRPVLIPGDGTTLSQIGHVDDGAVAMRMLMMQPQTFGKRYNLTGRDYWSDEAYVDIFGEVMGVTPEKVYIPAPIMDEIYAGKGENDASRKANPTMNRAGDSAAVTMASHDPRAVGVRGLIQRLGPNIHNWNESTFFSVERLWEDVGFRPAYTFEAAVEQTYDWFARDNVSETLQFDYSWEDNMLQRLGAR
jgi:nucleoside-diphosphate-sugar epimerase